jgi:hypothetical protein
MSDVYPVDKRDSGEMTSPTRIRWDWWEVLAFGVLVALGLLVVSGAVGGIIRSTQPNGPFGQLGFRWDAVQFGSSWASPYFAVVLLAVLGTSWWSKRLWDAAPGSNEAVVHYGRARSMRFGVQAGLAILAVASVLGFIGLIEENATIGGSSSQATSIEVSAGIDTLAVLVLVGVGMWVSTRLDAQA